MKRVPRKALSLLLSLAMLLGLCMPTAFAAEGRYSDTAGHWAEAAIQRWSEYGIIQGNNGKFQPDDSITRAQMATILARTLGLTKTNGNPFSDVANDAWYAPGILCCYAAGVMQGSNGKANPDSLVTRQEAMVMLGRALCVAAEQSPDLSTFTDGETVGDWAAPYVAALVKSGIVGGVGGGKLAPNGNMSRAALLTVLDRAVIQYINQPGTYTLTDKSGIVLVVAGDVTLSGKTSADILVTPAADGKALTFEKATVTGAITVQANGVKLTNKNSTLPTILTTGEGTVVDGTKPTTPTTGGGSGGSSGGSGGGGGGDPVVSDLTVSESKTVTGGTYKNVTITAAVGDGTVTLDSVTIQGSLTIQGGGSNSINLMGCAVSGKVILDKQSGQAPRLHLTNTPISQVEASKPAIIEADDTASAITTVTAKANVEVKGSNTAISSITVPAAVSAPVSVTVTAGTVAKVEAKSETTVSGAANAIASVVAEAPVTVASDAVGKVEVPATAGAGVTVAVTGNSNIEVAVNSTNGAAITASDGASVEVSTELETPPANVTVGGTPVTHIHKWNAGIVTLEPTCKVAGVKTYTCTADGCTDPIAIKAEHIPALPHTVVNDPAVAATCDTTGKTAGSHCSVCNTILVAQTEIPATGHKWGEWKSVDSTNHTRACENDKNHVETGAHTEVVDPAVAADCLTAGKAEGKHCSVCNAVITAQEVIPALGHDFIASYLNDADGHWHKCSRCVVTDTKATHTYNTANCAEAATCTVCTYEKAAGTHAWGQWEKVDEENHKHVCTLCNTLESKPHTWDAGVVTTPPTESTEGVKTFTCKDCAAEKRESVPPDGQELKTAVPTNLKLSAANQGIALTMTAPTAAEQEKIANTIQYTLYVDGIKDATRNISATVISTAFLPSYRNLSVGTAQIRYEIKSPPTEAALAEGYVAGTTSFEAVITLTEEAPLTDASGITATITADGTLTLTGLMPNQVYEIDAYEKDSGGLHLSRIFQADDTGTYRQEKVTVSYNEMTLSELSFSNLTDNSASIVRRSHIAPFTITAGA